MEIKQLNEALDNYHYGIKQYIDDKYKPVHWFPPNGNRPGTWIDAIKYAVSKKNYSKSIGMVCSKCNILFIRERDEHSKVQCWYSPDSQETRR